MSEYGSATWKISLWLCNDQGVYNYMRSEMSAGESAESAFYELFTDETPDSMAKSMFLDLLGLVDWYEIESDLKRRLGRER